MDKNLVPRAEDEILKFLTLNPESNLVDIVKHIRGMDNLHLLGTEPSSLTRTVLNRLVKRGIILATPCKKEVISVVPMIVKFGYRNENMYTKNTEVLTKVWFTYSVTGPTRNSLIGEHIYGI